MNQWTDNACNNNDDHGINEHIPLVRGIIQIAIKEKWIEQLPLPRPQ